jgi:uncharacterized protein (DUF1697 family)
MAGKIAMLRGINVGGKHVIRMEDLKDLFRKQGFENPTTYIQSGNVLFDGASLTDDEISIKLENAIFKKYGFNVPVIVRSADEIEKYAEENPFRDKDINKLHLTFLKVSPATEKIRETAALDSGQDKFVVRGKVVFICCEGKYHLTKLSNQFFERNLETQATTRNWKTVLKLVELSKK